MKQIQVALISHVISDDNLGCGALAISHIRLLDEVFASMGLSVKYIIAATDNQKQLDMGTFTNNQFEYRLYPRCRQTIKNPVRLLKTKVFDGTDIAFNLCGGDGYTDIYSFGRLMAESQLAWVAKLKKTPMIYAPQTIGPFQTKKGRLLAAQTLRKVDTIFVRDHQSYECCEKLGLQDRTIEVIDVAFALPYEKKETAGETVRIGINVSGLLYNGGYNRSNYFGLSFDYAAFIRSLLGRLKQLDAEIHLVPHVISESNEIEDDYRVCEMLAKQYGCILAPRFSSPIEAKSYISGMSLFSGARMHSTIGALSSGVPVIPVAYSRKFNGLYASLDYPWLIDAKSGLSEDEAVERFLVFLQKQDKMQVDVKTAKTIYTTKLEQYKSQVKEAVSAYVRSEWDG